MNDATIKSMFFNWGIFTYSTISWKIKRVAPTWLSSRSWHQRAQTGPVSLLPSQHPAGTKTPGERRLEAGLWVGGCTFTSSRTGNVHEQRRLPSHLWLTTPNSDFPVLLLTPSHLFTRVPPLGCGRHTCNRTHPQWSSASPRPSRPLPFLPRSDSHPPPCGPGPCPPTSPPIRPPEASRHHILLILISEDLTTAPISPAPGHRQRPGCWSSLLCSPSTARPVL